MDSRVLGNTRCYIGALFHPQPTTQHCCAEPPTRFPPSLNQIRKAHTGGGPRDAHAAPSMVRMHVRMQLWPCARGEDPKSGSFLWFQGSHRATRHPRCPRFRAYCNMIFRMGVRCESGYNGKFATSAAYICPIILVLSLGEINPGRRRAQWPLPDIESEACAEPRPYFLVLLQAVAFSFKLVVDLST